MKSLTSVFSLLIAFGSIEHSYANPFVFPTPTASPSPGGTSTTLSIPCLDGTTVKNAPEAEVCKALLPKCSDMKKILVTQLKDMLEWKIYGYYYLNKDIRLDKLATTINASALEGEVLPNPVCSVVGHKVSGNEAGEVEKQNIPNGLSCGRMPIFQNGNSSSYKTKIQYEGEQGKLWFSWVMGAYPWELRRAASDVIGELHDNLDNLNQVVNNSAMNADVVALLKKIKDSTIALAADAKTTCNAPHEFSVLEMCLLPAGSGGLSATDPIQKLCTLAKIQASLTKGSMPNMLVYEAMERTKKMHERYFGGFFNADTNPNLKLLIKHCSDTKSIVEKIQTVMSPVAGVLKGLIQARKAYSCNASCLSDGETMYTGDNWASTPSSNSGQRQRKCAKKSRFNLVDGEPASSLLSHFESESFIKWVWNTGDPGWWSSSNENTPDETLAIALGITNPTNNVGFAAMVESLIRREICPQAGHSKTGANACDSVGINMKPCGIYTEQAACTAVSVCNWKPGNNLNKCERKL